MGKAAQRTVRPALNWALCSKRNELERPPPLSSFPHPRTRQGQCRQAERPQGDRRRFTLSLRSPREWRQRSPGRPPRSSPGRPPPPSPGRGTRSPSTAREAWHVRRTCPATAPVSPTPARSSPKGGLARTRTFSSTCGHFSTWPASTESGCPASRTVRSSCRAVRSPSPVRAWSRKMTWPDCSPPRFAPSRRISSST